MAAKKCDHRKYWNIYWALNTSHCRAEEIVCSHCGKQVMLSFQGKELFENDKILSIFSMFQWMAPAILIIVVALIF